MNRKTQNGFTLIELMIVVVIVGILSLIAYPSYQESVRKTRRGAAAACMQEIAQQMERRFTTSMRYNSVMALPVLACRNEVSASHTIRFSVDQPSASGFALEAEPSASQANDGCGNLTLDERGRKGISGDATRTAAQCW